MRFETPRLNVCGLKQYIHVWVHSSFLYGLHPVCVWVPLSVSCSFVSIWGRNPSRKCVISSRELSSLLARVRLGSKCWCISFLRESHKPGILEPQSSTLNPKSETLSPTSWTHNEKRRWPTCAMSHHAVLHHAMLCHAIRSHMRTLSSIILLCHTMSCVLYDVEGKGSFVPWLQGILQDTSGLTICPNMYTRPKTRLWLSHWSIHEGFYIV